MSMILNISTQSSAIDYVTEGRKREISLFKIQKKKQLISVLLSFQIVREIKSDPRD